MIKSQLFLRREYKQMLAIMLIKQMVLVVKAITDTLVAGQALGDSGLTIVALTAPFFLVLAFVEAPIVVGGITAAQRAVGGGNKTECNRLFSQTAIALLVVGALFSGGSYLLAGQWAALFGNGSPLISQCASYLRAVAPFCLFLSFKNLLILAACNDGKLAFVRVCMIGEMVLNGVLDLLLVGPMGVDGVALATGLSGLFSCAVLFFAFLRNHFSYRFTPNFSWRSFLSSAALGLPIGAIAALSGVTAIAVNRYVVGTFGERAVLLYSFVGIYALFTNMLVAGSQDAMQPFASVYYGEKNPRSLRALGNISARCILLLGALLSITFAALSPFMGRLFGADASLWAQVGQVIRIQCLFTVLYGASGVLSAFYAGSGHIPLSFANILLRTSALLYPAAVLLGSGFGVQGLWFARPLAECGALLVTLLVSALRMRRGLTPLWLTDRHGEDVSLCVDIDGSMDSYLQARTQAEAFLRRHGAPETTISKAMLYIEETGTLAHALKLRAAEMTLLLGEKPVLILCDNSPVDYTDADALPTSPEAFSALRILNSASSKLHLRTIGYNRVVYTLDPWNIPRSPTTR